MKIKVAVIILFLSFVGWGTVFGQYDERIGEEVCLRAAEQPVVIYCGVDKRSFNTLMGNHIAQDKQNYMALLMGHKAFELNYPTRARVLEYRFPEQTAKVLILEGTYKGRVGWVLLNQAFGY